MVLDASQYWYLVFVCSTLPFSPAVALPLDHHHHHHRDVSWWYTSSDVVPPTIIICRYHLALAPSPSFFQGRDKGFKYTKPTREDERSKIRGREQ